MNEAFWRQGPDSQPMACIGKAVRFSKFSNASRTKYWASAMNRGRPEKLPKWQARPAWNPSGAMGKIKSVVRIAVDIRIPPQELPATRCTIKHGPKRLMSPQNASLLVIKNTQRLHTCGPFDWEHLCDLIYIIGLGLPAVLASAWRSAGGRPSQLVPGQDVFLHAPACALKPRTFLLGDAFREDDNLKHIRCALQHCVASPRSKWKVLKDRGQPLAETTMVRVSTINQLATAIMQLRTFEADSFRHYAVEA